MKLRTLTLALVALCLTIVANAHPIGKYIRHRKVATADHIYAYDGHGHDKYRREYRGGQAKNNYYCSGLDHHTTCRHGRCHHFNAHHARRCHDHTICVPHSGTSCGHHKGCGSCHPSDRHGCGDGCAEKCSDKEEETVEIEVEEVYEDDKRARVRRED